MEPVKLLKLKTDTDIRTLDVVRFTILVTLVAIEFYLLSEIWLVPSKTAGSTVIFNRLGTQTCEDVDMRRWTPVYEIALFNLVVLSFGFVVFVFFNRKEAILLGTTSVFVLTIAFIVQLTLSTTLYRYAVVRPDCTVLRNVQNTNFIVFKSSLIFLGFLLGAFSPFSKLGDNI